MTKILSILFILILFVGNCFGATPFWPSIDGLNNQYGEKNAFGKVYFYEVGTETEKDVYSDYSESSTISQPVVLDGVGKSFIFIDGTYRVIIKDRNDTTISDITGVSSSSGGGSISEINDIGDVNIGTAVGTIAYRDYSGDLVGLPMGSSNSYLQMQASGVPTWTLLSTPEELNDLDDVTGVGGIVNTGTILVNNGSGYWVPISAGTEGQVLTSHATVSTLSWEDMDAMPSGTRGDILYYGASGWTQLNAGTDGHYLETNGAGTDPTWSSVDAFPSGTQGDILYFNGTSWVALGAGTDGHFLKTQGAGANPEWDIVTASKVDKVINIVAGAFDYPNGITHELAPLDYMDGTLNRIYYQKFDDSTRQYVAGSFAIPSDWANTNIIVDIYGFSETEITGDTSWDLETLKFNSSSAWTSAYSTTSTSGTTINSTINQRSKITITLSSSGLSDDDDIYFRLSRDVDDAGDDLSGDFNLTSVRFTLERD